MCLSECECQKRTCEDIFLSQFMCLCLLGHPEPKSVQGLEVMKEDMERVESCKVFMPYSGFWGDTLDRVEKIKELIICVFGMHDLQNKLEGQKEIAKHPKDHEGLFIWRECTKNADS